MTRRELLRAGGPWLASLAAPRLARSASAAEIRMRRDARGEHVGFDPIAILIRPGQTVRWIMDSPGNPHTTSAYHPRNARHSLRIPDGAQPWDFGFLVNVGDHFEVTLTGEGVYDYFCLPHEAAGMVGRIVVGRPAGPGTRPVDYFLGGVRHPGLAARSRRRPAKLPRRRSHRAAKSGPPHMAALTARPSPSRRPVGQQLTPAGVPELQ